MLLQLLDVRHQHQLEQVDEYICTLSENLEGLAALDFELIEISIFNLALI